VTGELDCRDPRRDTRGPGLAVSLQSGSV